MGLRCGLTKEETEGLRLGELLEIFDAYKEYHNMTIEKKIYKLPEPVVSLSDL